MLQSQCNKEATTVHISQYTRVDSDKSIKQFLQLPVVCIMFVCAYMHDALTGKLGTILVQFLQCFSVLLNSKSGIFWYAL